MCFVVLYFASVASQGNIVIIFYCNILWLIFLKHEFRGKKIFSEAISKFINL